MLEWKSVPPASPIFDPAFSQNSTFPGLKVKPEVLEDDIEEIIRYTLSVSFYNAFARWVNS